MDVEKFIDCFGGDHFWSMLLGHRADALFVDVESERGSWWLSADRNAKFH